MVFLLTIIHWIIISRLFLLVNSSGIQIAKQVQNRLSSVSSTNKYDKDSIEEIFPFLKSSCVKNALAKYMPICMIQGIDAIDSELRVETAIKLSICEFEESGLHIIPKECHEGKSTSKLECMVKLESYPQWWTTYSGNFQRLSGICFENSLPYEKEQILNLFLNVTEIYGEINENLQENFEKMMTKVETKSNQFIDKLSGRLFNLQDVVDSILEELYDQNITSEILDIKERNLKQWKDVEKASSDSLELHLYNQDQIFVNMESFFDEIKQNIRILSKEITSIAMENTFNELNVEVEKSFKNITDHLNKTVENIELLDNKISKFQRNIVSISKLIEQVFKGMSSITRFLLNRYTWIGLMVLYWVIKYLLKINVVLNSLNKRIPRLRYWIMLVAVSGIGHFTGNLIISKYQII